MIKKFVLLLSISMVLVLIMDCSTTPKNEGEVEASSGDAERMAWWREAKFGLFIHWGVYAVPAGKYGDNTNHGEWIMHSAKIPSAEYKEYANQFNPTKYDPEAWVKVAKEAGMRYIVITSKHHDGFALYPSDVTDWDVVDATPYGKDLLGPLVDEAKKAGLKMGFYYSQAQDWNHPGGAKSRFQEGDGWDEAHKGDFDAYLENIALPQAREILSRYPLDIFWWDTPTWMNEERTRPFVEALKARPDIITNNRLGIDGDTKTPEQFVPVTGHEGDWETCMTMNRHWGYNAYDDDWKSSEELIHKLIEICSKGGNFLLNVGPTAEGEFPKPCIERLQDMGAWLKVNGESIYGTTKGPFSYLSWGAATRKDDLLYLHVTDWPENGKLHVPITSKAVSAALLVHPDKMLSIKAEHERIVIDLPAEAPDPVATVIILKLAEEPVAMPLASEGKSISASSEHPDHLATHAVDGSGHHIWESADTTGVSHLEIDLEELTWIQAVGLDEPDRWPRYKQTVHMEAETDNGWEEVFSAKTNGHGLVMKFDPIQARRVRLNIERAEGPPAIAEWQLYSPE
ncbi:MAG: alpha-L-fucosidase [Bacteroidales bacterium]|nr:alpha-L-fucosidase [Bacteroidales bacterium]